MKLYGVTTTYNNEAIVPYVMKYVQALGYDKFIVYDNESTDNTVELLKQYSFVEVRTFKHIDIRKDGKVDYYLHKVFNDNKRSALMTGFWDLYSEHTKDAGGYVSGKTETAWITVTDFDEVLYFQKQYNWDLKRYLQHITRAGYNVCNEDMLNLIGEHMPYDKDIFVHRQIKRCAYGDPFDWKKPLLLRLDNIHRLLFWYGQHALEVKFLDQKPKALSGTRHLHVFHLKYAFGENQYNKLGDAVIGIKESLENSIDIGRYFEHKMLNGIVPDDNTVLEYIR